MGNNDFSFKSEIGDPKIEYSNYFPINSQGSKALWYLWVWMAHSHEKWDLSKRLWTSLTDNHCSCLLMQLNRNMVIENLSIFGFKPKFWTIPTANMTYVRSQNYKKMEVGEHRIQTFKVVVVVSLLVMLFDVFVPYTSLLDMSRGVVCPNVLKCQLMTQCGVQGFYSKVACPDWQ